MLNNNREQKNYLQSNLRKLLRLDKIKKKNYKKSNRSITRIKLFN